MTTKERKNENKRAERAERAEKREVRSVERIQAINDARVIAIADNSPTTNYSGFLAANTVAMQGAENFNEAKDQDYASLGHCSPYGFEFGRLATPFCIPRCEGDHCHVVGERADSLLIFASHMHKMFRASNTFARPVPVVELFKQPQISIHERD